MEFPFGIDKEAQIYLSSAQTSMAVNRAIAEKQFPTFIHFFEEEGMGNASYEEIVDYILDYTIGLVNVHKQNFPTQGWDIRDEESISWFLIMLSLAFEKFSSHRISSDKLFIDVFKKHFSSI